MYDTIIIGAGPAGMSAAIYLKNANKNVIIFEKEVPGGKILKTKKISNYLGFSSKDPSEISYEMYKQVTDLGIKIIMEKVLDVQKDDNEIKVITNNGEYKSKTLLIACGRIEKSLGIENESKLVGNGVSYCSTCDGSLYKNKVVAVVGNSELSKEETIYLSNIAKKVYYINYNNKNIKFGEENIEVINNKRIISLNEDDNKLYSITLSDNEEIKIDGLFILNGYTPNIEFIKNLNIKNEDGYILVSKDMKTSIDNVYAVGDIIKKDLYQIVTAASEGAIAGINIIKLLNN